jgi:hypothetical protein
MWPSIDEGMVSAEKGMTFDTGRANACGYILELKEAQIEVTLA